MSERMDKSEPKRTIAEIRADVETKDDGLGLGVDDGIKETVVGLLANELPTIASCEGHLDRGFPTPWVDIRTPKPKEADDDEPGGLAEAQWRESNKRLESKLSRLLAEFYDGRESEIRLGYEEFQNSSGMRLWAQPRINDPELFEVSRAEMEAFGQWLVALAEDREKQQ